MRRKLILPVLALLLLSVASVQAAKPAQMFVDIEHFVIVEGEMTSVGLQKVTLIVHSIEDGVYYNSMTAVITGRIYVEGELVGVVKVTMSYKGTMTGTMDADPITGKLVYSLVAPEEFPEASRHLVIWFDEGDVERQIGEGEPWFP